MPRKPHGQCLICDDDAIGINFGVPTCMPCKAFFRRNANLVGTRDFICQHDGECLITYKYRRSCNCCRLAKCFRVGMKKSFILTDEERESRNKVVAENRLKRGKIPKPQTIVWMQLPKLLSVSPNSTQYLSPLDEALLSNIFHAYEKTCIAARNAQFPSFPAAKYDSLHEFFNEISLAFPVFIEYFKLIPEFENIMMDDRIRLLKNHFCIIVSINEFLMHPETSSNLVATWTNLFGIDVTERLLKRNQLLDAFLYDFILLKLVLIVLVLSSSNSRNIDDVDLDLICDNSLLILSAQNIYVELLWKYILSRTDNEKDAVKFFNKLMMCILYVQNIDMYIDGHICGLTHEINQLEPLVKIMWPKTDLEDEITDTILTEDIADIIITEDIVDNILTEDIIDNILTEDLPDISVMEDLIF
ncbi:unnamed protein product [Rotaria socialis]|uniref:Nuclear receptor domain-containing protein n=1 Tax=Rotaria socialis TaxID=392032 RepID=A0A821FVS5_9BILA|nr:unnamed protein product [Rotaria socialis]CAF4657493.1 unnamed protein product [Rotaria socialis]